MDGSVVFGAMWSGWSHPPLQGGGWGGADHTDCPKNVDGGWDISCGTATDQGQQMQHLKWSRETYKTIPTPLGDYGLRSQTLAQKPWAFLPHGMGPL